MNFLKSWICLDVLIPLCLLAYQRVVSSLVWPNSANKTRYAVVSMVRFYVKLHVACHTATPEKYFTAYVSSHINSKSRAESARRHFALMYEFLCEKEFFPMSSDDLNGNRTKIMWKCPCPCPQITTLKNHGCRTIIWTVQHNLQRPLSATSTQYWQLAIAMYVPARGCIATCPPVGVLLRARPCPHLPLIQT